MQNLREKLMSAGFVTETQKKQSDSAAEKRARREGGRGRKRGRKSSQPYGDGEPDPVQAAVTRAVDAHRLQGDTRGAEEFQVDGRDGLVRKMLITHEVVHALNTGRAAVIEWGEPARHTLVSREAVPAIREACADAIRFFNEHGATS